MKPSSRRVFLVAFPVFALSFAAVVSAGCSLGYDGSTSSSSGGFRGATGPAPTFGAVVTQAVPPPPIAGGTLLAGKRGGPSLVADPDRHALYVVDVRKGTSRTILLPESDEPGRAVHDAAGRAHVAMRASGDLVTIDLASATILARRSACVAARGVAYDAKEDAVVVACSEGGLGVFPAAGGAALRRIATDRDVRDVWVTGDTIFVSRFRSAEVLTFDRTGSLVRRRPMPGANVAWRMTAFSLPPDAGTPEPDDADAGCTSRDAAAPDASADADADADAAATTPPDCEDTAPAEPPSLPPDVPIVVDQTPRNPAQTGSVVGYYAGGSTPCTASSVVGTRVELLAAGSVVIPDAVLPVDVATNGRHVAVAAAGHGHTPELAQLYVFDARGLLPTSASSSSSGGDYGSSGYSSSSGGFGTGRSTDCNDILRVSLPGQVVAAAFDGDGRLLVQSREPAALYVMSPDYRTVRRTIPLSDESREDTGHAIFHANSGGFIACASCHPEGGEDARTWVFDVGQRRTPSLRGTLAHTEPFHWSGDIPDVHALVEHVFVTRMSGPRLGGPEEGALKSWVYTIPAPRPPSAPSTASQRGEDVFRSRGCGTCHVGSLGTNNQTLDVGTGEAVQVPPLRGVGWRAPFLHDGCAKTMAERFTPSCGGASHGDVEGMTAQERSDLVAYLDTL